MVTAKVHRSKKPSTFLWAPSIFFRGLYDTYSKTRWPLNASYDVNKSLTTQAEAKIYA